MFYYTANQITAFKNKKISLQIKKMITGKENVVINWIINDEYYAMVSFRTCINQSNRKIWVLL